jgi:hypothetical protein
VRGGGEGEFVSAGCWVPNSCWSACSDAEMRVAGSFGGPGVGWTGWSGGEGVLEEGGDGVLRKHHPVRGRGRCGGEMLLPARW